MSGFAGIVRLDPTPESADADRAALDRMAPAIAFRGPDAQQQWFGEANHSAGASFAFSFLTTGPAPQSPAQPVTLDGKTWLLGDVRCDGSEELIEKLRQHGTSVAATATSEELILHFVAAFGESTLPELFGDFSFVLYKPRDRNLFAFRDLTGARPFFYVHRNDAFIFSNTLQAVLAHPEVSRRDCDEVFIKDFLLGSSYYDPLRTIYGDIRRLPAGSLLHYGPQGLHVRRIANLPVDEPLSFKKDEEVIEEFRRLFTLAVRDRLPAGNATLLLSGGLDSTSIAAVALAQRKKTGTALALDAVTLDFQPLHRDEEGILAEKFASGFSLPLQLLHLAHILPLDGIEKIPPAPEPFAWPYWRIQPFYTQHIRKSSRVMLTGDGGDEILRAQGGPYLRHLSRSGMHRPVSEVMRYTVSRQKLPALGMGIESLFRRLAGQPVDAPAFPEWLAHNNGNSSAMRDRFAALSAKPTSSHPYNPCSYAKLNGHLASLMELQDATHSGSPVESRAPFFDRRLLTFLLRLPPIPWFMEKELLRRAMSKKLPEEILTRPKVPLQDDPLLLHIAAGKWSPRSQAPSSNPRLDHLVNWSVLRDCLGNSPDTAIHVHIRPILLHAWLNTVEKGRGIQ